MQNRFDPEFLKFGVLSSIEFTMGEVNTIAFLVSNDWSLILSDKGHRSILNRYRSKDFIVGGWLRVPAGQRDKLLISPYCGSGLDTIKKNEAIDLKPHLKEFISKAIGMSFKEVKYKE